MSASNRLRVGFVYEQPLQQWIARAIELTDDLDTVEQVVGIALPPVRCEPSAFDVYARADVALLGRPCRAGLAGSSTVLTRPSEPEELAALTEELAFDVLVNVTGGPLQAGLDVRHGVWEIRHGRVPAAAAHAVFAEFAAGTGACATTVSRAGPGGGTVLYATRSLVRRLSFARAREPIQWKAAALVPRLLRRGIPAEGMFVPDSTPDAPPRSKDVLVLAARLACRVAAHVAQRAAQRPTWTIAWRRTPHRARTAPDFGQYRLLDPPSTRFHADPFLTVEGGRHFLFYESYVNALGRAELAVVELTEDGAGPPRTVLERPYHLSYPFVFQWQGEHFMIPESAESRRVQLFRATAFPYEWELDSILLDDIEAYDATFVEVDGVCFLFAAMREPGADIDELHLFSAPDLRGPYTPHPQNPVVSDVARARPAGRLYWDDGRLIRPGQDGVGGYGRAVALNEVVRLSPEGYCEAPLTVIDASWSPEGLGTHTVDYDGEIEVMDLRCRRPRFALPSRGNRSARDAAWDRTSRETVPGPAS